jgi:hypothetical protein
MVMATQFKEAGESPPKALTWELKASIKPIAVIKP